MESDSALYNANQTVVVDGATTLRVLRGGAPSLTVSAGPAAFEWQTADLVLGGGAVNGVGCRLHIGGGGVQFDSEMTTGASALVTGTGLIRSGASSGRR